MTAFLVPGTITGRTPDSDAPTLASAVYYAARGFDASGNVFSVTGAKPFRWCGDDEEIHPAKLNAPCLIGRIGAQTFLIVAEKPAVEECEEEAP